jgi:hypothetical protein
VFSSLGLTLFLSSAKKLLDDALHQYEIFGSLAVSQYDNLASVVVVR